MRKLLIALPLFLAFSLFITLPSDAFGYQETTATKSSLAPAVRTRLADDGTVDPVPEPEPIVVVPTTLPGNEPEQPTLDAVQFTSIAGIMVLTTIVVSVLKRLMGDTVFSQMPIFLYTTIVALLLVTVARYILKTLDGNIAVLLWDTLKTALGSAGFYAWVIQGKGMTMLKNTRGGALNNKTHI